MVKCISQIASQIGDLCINYNRNIVNIIEVVSTLYSAKVEGGRIFSFPKTLTW